jgi:hypothetical protein
VDELIAADHDPDMRGARRDCREEDEVARLEGDRRNRAAHLELLSHLTRQGHAVLPEDVLNEAAAIEARRIEAAVAIGRAAQ